VFSRLKHLHWVRELALTDQAWGGTPPRQPEGNDMSDKGLTEAQYAELQRMQANARATIAKHGTDSFAQSLKDERDFPRKSGKVK
jgi:hypothetical protein